jgi:Flp pilus assembly protein TadD
VNQRTKRRRESAKRTHVEHAVIFALLAGLPLTLPAGCAATPASAPTAISARESADAIARLRALAEAEAVAPPGPALPPPPGVEFATASTSDDPAERAKRTMSFAGAIASLPRPADLAPIPSIDPDDDTSVAATMAYVRGRSALLSGDPSGAIPELQTAAKLNASAPEPWRELAEAQRQLGRRSSSVAALQQAVRRGLRDPNAYFQLGRDAARSRRPAEGARLLAEALELHPERFDPALPLLIRADLAEALVELGFDAAAVELLATAGTGGGTLSGSTRYAAEFAEFSRRRTELVRTMGDSAARLGLYEQAGILYSEAASGPTLDPADALTRQTALSLVRGRPAEACLRVVEDIQAGPGGIDDRRIALVRHLASVTTLGPLLVEAIAQAVPPDAPRSIAGRFARLKAAALAPEPAQAVRRAHLRAFPDDTEVLAETIGAERDARARADDLARCATMRPELAAEFADVAFHDGRGIAELVEALGSGSAERSAALVRAFLLGRLGRPADGADSLASAKLAEPQEYARLAAEVALNAACGRWDRAEAARRELISSAPAADSAGLWALSVAAAHRAMQDPAAALEAVQAHSFEGDRLAAGAALAGAEAASRAGRPELAAELLDAATAADPSDERPQRAKISFFGPAGAKPDQERFADAVRALRDLAPADRFIRRLAARELADRGVWSQAEPQLRALGEEDPGDPQTVSMLVDCWRRSAGNDAERARRDAWLRDRLAQRPDSVALAAGLAQWLAATDRAPEAEKLLESALAKFPVPTLAQLRESIVRDRLKEPERATRLARARLEGRTRSIEENIELADLEVASGNADAAPAVLREGLPDGIALTAEQSGAVLALIVRVVQDSTERGKPETVAPLLVFAAERGLELPISLYEGAMIAVAQRENPEKDAIRSVASAVVRQSAGAFNQSYARIRTSVREDRFPAGVLAAIDGLVGGAIASAAPINERILFDYAATVSSAGNGDDARRMLATFATPERVRTVYSAFKGEADGFDAEGADIPPELIHLLGIRAAALGRIEAAESLYRLSLEMKPRHAMSANNLAYHLIETNGDLVEAERLLKIALEEEPESHHILDSLGWLYYRQDRLADTPDGPGAVTLLLRAVGIEDGEASAVIQDHTGDALWAAGRKPEAVDRWRLALSLAQQEAELLRGIGQNAVSLLAELRRVASSTRAKLTAVDEGREPEIAAHTGAAPK